MGLAVAIPAILIYTMIHNRTVKIIDEIDEHTVKLINLLTGNR
jgi:biopolymer transport protein ExbB/TolQ